MVLAAVLASLLSLIPGYINTAPLIDWDVKNDSNPYGQQDDRP